MINPRDRPLQARKLASFTWKLALDDEAALSEAELRRLAQRKAPLVNLRGRWVEVSAAAGAAAAELLEAGYRAGEDASVLEVLRRAAGFEVPPWDLPVRGLDPDGALGELVGRGRDRASATLPLLGGFRGELRAYQARGVAWLQRMGTLGLGACLADDMGLGKTVQVLALLADEKSRGISRGPTLLVAPTSVLTTWLREAERFAPDLRVLVHQGPDRQRGEGFPTKVKGYDLVVTGYPLLARDRAEWKSLAWGRLVLDEAQAVKNPRTQAARVLRTLQVGSRIALTGTPVENRLGDLWALMDLLEPGLLGTRPQFRGRFEVPVERHRDEEASALLRRLVGPFILRRVKSEVLPDLPEKDESRCLVGMTREQVSLYQAVLDDMMKRVESSSGIERRGLVLTTLTKLRQVCNHPAHLLHEKGRLGGRSGKLLRLEELVDEALVGGEKVLIFSQFKAMGELLVEHLEERGNGPVLFLHGGVSRPARDAMVTRFQEDEEARVMMLSLKAGGTGLTLTAATRVVHYDRWWNPAVEDQATDRAHRIGQDRTVVVRKLVCRGTLEERLDQILVRKRELAGEVVRSGETWITELSDGELREMVRLSAPEVPTL